MKQRPAKTIWIGVICLGVLVYLLLLGQVNIRQFENKLIVRSQKNLLQLAQARQQHCSDLLGLMSRQLIDVADRICDLSHFPEGTDSEPDAPPLLRDPMVLSFHQIDTHGVVVRSFSGDPETASYEATLSAYWQDSPAMDKVSLRMDAASGRPCFSMLYPLAEGTTVQGLLVLRISTVQLLERLNHDLSAQGLRTCLIDADGRIFGGNSGADSAASPTVIGENNHRARLMLDDIRHRQGGIGTIFQEGPSPRGFLAGYWPIDGLESPWMIAVIQDDNTIQSAVAEHARDIQTGMVCLFLAVFLIWLLFYRSVRRRILYEQQTALARATEELHHVSEQNRQTRQQYERQITLYRGLLNAVPMGLYWKNCEGRLAGYNPEYAHIAGLKRMEDGLLSARTELFEPRQDGLPLDMEVMNKDIELLFLPQTVIQNGLSRNYLVSKIPVNDEKGKVCGLLGGLLNQDLLKSGWNNSFCTYLRDHCAAEALAAPVLMVDRQGRILHVNAACLRRFEKDTQPAFQQELTAIFTSETAETILRNIGDFSVTQCTEPKGFYLRWRRDCFWTTAQPMYEGGMLKGVLLLLTDVGEIRQPEEERENEIVSKIDSRLQSDSHSGPTRDGIERSGCPVAGGPETETQKTVLNQETMDMQDSNKPAERQPDRQTARILVVDDVEENRALLEVILSKLGYVPVQCSGGKQAVMLCRQDTYDIILMDIQMPEVNGLEAVNQIRADSLNAAVPIIAMTASNQKDDELAALDCGCDDYLIKPINRKLLEQKIWRNLAKMRQIRQAEQGQEITSFLEGDPDYHKTIETFVGNLPSRIADMRQAFEKQDFKELAFKVHALKGLGGFAGFAVFTEKAARIEDSLREKDVDKIQAQIDEMVQLCMRTKIKSDIN
jgi:CheY-like chemotaxis protein/PAS domain-containing protein